LLYSLLLIQKDDKLIIKDDFVDQRHLKTYIIDVKEAKEADDAISIEQRSNKESIIWIHISSPSLFLETNSDIDNQAKERGSSLYLIDQYIPMLNLELINRCGFKSHKESKSLSIGVILTNEGHIKSYNLIQSIIQPNLEINYEEADELIQLRYKEEQEICELYQILKNRSSLRKLNGALLIDQTYGKLNYKDSTVQIEIIEPSNSRLMISEAMILMGECISQYMKENSIPTIYRCHKYKCDINQLLKTYHYYESKYTIIKQFIGKSYLSTKVNEHNSMGLESYLQVTSPLRRYTDLLIHRQIISFLVGKPLISEDEITNYIDRYNKIIRSNNLYIRQNQNKYLNLFFMKSDNKYWKVFFIRWINNKRSIALVKFADIYYEALITLYINTEMSIGKLIFIKYNSYNKDNNNLTFVE